MLSPRTEKHLKTVIAAAIVEKALDPIEAFEVASKRIRASKLSAISNDSVTTDPSGASSVLVLDAIPTDLESKEPLALIPVGDIESEISSLRAIGSGFSAAETFRLGCIIRKFASGSELGVSGVRFWGKVLTRSGEYLILEGDPESPSDPPEGSDEDGLGTGVNSFVYFASSDAGNQWSRLPNSTPSQIRASRRFKYILTGELRAPIPCYPAFPGDERALLRAQIARISAACTIAPLGKFTADEEGAVTANEEFLLNTSPDSAEISKWVYARPYILRNGRIKYPEVPEDDDSKKGEIEQLKRDMHFDPVPAPLRVLDKHEWYGRVYGNLSSYVRSLPEGKIGEDWHCTVALRNKEWQGAVTIAQGKKFKFFYCGYGIKHGNSCFISEPPDLMPETFDPQEQIEPHPKIEKPTQ